MSASVSVVPNLLAAGFGALPGQKMAGPNAMGMGGAVAEGFEALLGALFTGEPAEQPGQSAAAPAIVTAAATVPAQAKAADALGDDALMDEAAKPDADPQATVQPDLLLAGLVIPFPIAPAPQVQAAPVVEDAAPQLAATKAGSPWIAPLVPPETIAAPEPAPADNTAPHALGEPAVQPPTAPGAQVQSPLKPQPAVVTAALAIPTPQPGATPAGVDEATPAAPEAASPPTPAAQVQTQVQAPIPAPVQAQAAETVAAPAAAKAPAPKEEPAVEAAPASGPAKSRKAAAPQAGAEAASAAKPGQAGFVAPIVVGDESKTDTAANDRQPDAQAQAAPVSGAGPASQAHAAQPATPVRGAPETVAHLSAQIVKKLDGRSTRFDVALNPLGLGQVDVRVEIGAEGKISAALAFDNPQAAAELRARAHELTKALEQAGLDLSGGISFDVASDQGRQNGRGFTQDDNGAAFRGRAFQAALEANDAADAAAPALAAYSRRADAGVDVRI